MIGIALGVAAPANVLIGPHQDKFCLVYLRQFGISDPQDLKRDAPASGSRRYVVSGGAIERQQREPGPELVVQRRAIGKVNVRQSRARQRRGLVGNRVAGNIDMRLRHDNRRICIAVAHFDAVAFVLRVSEPLDTDARFGEGRVTLGVSGVGEVLIGFPDRQSYAHMAPGRLTIAQPYRAAFSIVGLQKSRPRVAFQSRGQLPADVERIANARIHPVAARRNELVGRITGEENPSATVALSNEQMWVPGVRNEGLECERSSREAMDQRRRIDFVQPGFGREKSVQSPDVPIVLRDHRRLRRLIVPGDAPWLQDVAGVGTKMHHVKLSDAGNSVVTDVQASADLADAAIAANQILALDFLGLTGVDVPNGRDHGIRALNKVLECDAEPYIDLGFRLDRALENWLDGDLGNPHCRFNWLRAVVALANDRPRLLDARIAKPMQFVPRKGRDPRHVEIVCLWNGDVTKMFRHPKLSKQFHAA